MLFQSPASATCKSCVISVARIRIQIEKYFPLIEMMCIKSLELDNFKGHLEQDFLQKSLVSQPFDYRLFINLSKTVNKAFW